MNQLSRKTSYKPPFKANPICWTSCKPNAIRAFLKKMAWLILPLLFVNTASAQIWSENFNTYPDGTTNAAVWTTLATDCDDPALNDGNQWGVFGGQFVINDVEGAPCCTPDGGGNDNTWTSAVIDISDYCNVNISLNITATGIMECDSPSSPVFGCQNAGIPDNTHDQVVVEFILDGGSPIQFGYVCGDNGIGNISINNLNGSSLQIQFSGATKGNAEFYFVDDIIVDGTLCLCDRLSDSLSLVALYNSTDGPNWTNTWDLVQPMDTWYGVFLNTDGCVTCLDFDGNPNCNEFAGGGNGLTGTLPIEIGSLTRLEKIFFSLNQLTGNIPPEIGNLGRLKELYLSANSLSGPIPSQLGNLKNMQKLFLLNNNLTGEIPDELGNLTNLIQLYLDGNQLTGNIPASLGNLTKVENFSMSNNMLDGAIPSTLGNLSKVVTLTLNDNLLSGAIPATLGNLDSLESFSLSHNQLSGNIPASFGNLAKVTQILLSNNLLTGSIPSELGALSNLSQLSLGDNMLSGSIPPELGNLSSLTEFFLNDNNLEGCFPDEIVGHCGITFNCINNPGLPWGGDMAMWCSGSNQIGAPCDDGNPNTIGDVIQPNCSCLGTSVICPPPGMPPIGNNCVSAPLSCLGIDGYCGELGTDNSATPYPYCPSNVLNNDDWIAFIAGSTEITLEITPFNCQGINMNFGMQGGLTEGSCSGTAMDVQCVCTTASFQLSSANFTIGEIYYLVLDGCAGDICEYIINVTTGTTFAPPMSPGSISGPTNPTPGATTQYSVPSQNFTSYDWSITPAPMGTTSNNPSTDTVDIVWNMEGTAQLCVTASNPCFNNPNPSCITVDVSNLPSCQLTDSLALVALYNSTNGQNWTNTWDLSQPMNTWYGVTVNGDGCVICLDLDGGAMCSPTIVGAGNNLVGTIPPELGNLSSLISLYLSHNELSGPIPPELGNLSNIAWLWLDFNQLSGDIPVELTALPNLTILSLANNQIEGSIPPQFGSTSSLAWLSLSYNQLSGNIPAQLGNLSNLERLYLDENDLTGSIPVELGALSELTTLNLRNNNLTGSIPKELFAPPLLDWLSLSSNQLTGPIPPEIQNLTNLSQLYLEYNQLSGELPVELGTLTSIIVMLLNNNQFSGSIPEILGDLVNLNQLNLNFNQLSGTIPLSLATLPNIDLFSASSNQLEGCFPIEWMAHCDINCSFYNNPLLPWQGDFQNFCNGEPQIGAPCDDGDANTENDEIQLDCTCKGQVVNSCLVTNTNDSGPGSLREAINCANSNLGADTIVFDISGTGPFVIDLLSNLPEITDDSTTLDGASQPNFYLGSIKITNAPNAGLFVNNVNGFSLQGISISNSGERGLDIRSSTSVDIGLKTPNFFYDNGKSWQNAENVFLANCNNSIVANNNIGYDESGAITSNSNFGIVAYGNNITIENNTITGFSGAAKVSLMLRDSPSGGGPPSLNLIARKNEIYNCQNGIYFFGGLGGEYIVDSNLIYNCTYAFYNQFPGNTATLISKNSIYCNGNAIANQNFVGPTILLANTSEILGNTTAVNGTVEVFISDDSGCLGFPCQGKTYLGTTTTDASGNWTLSAPFNTAVLPFDFVTATATDGNNNTSEFSTCAIVCPVSITNQGINICNGDTYMVGTSTYNATGIYNDTLSGFMGCDSIIITDLTILPSLFGNFSPSLCPGESIVLNGTIYDESNPTGSELLIASNGCDSTVMISLSFYLPATANISANICEGDNYAAGGQMFNVSGTYTIPLAGASINGCDSIITLDLTVNPLPTSNITPASTTTFCEGGNVELVGTSDPSYSYQWQSNGADILNANAANYFATTNGDYTLIVTDGNMCMDTSLSVSVTVNPLPSPTITPSETSGLANNDGILCLGDNAVLTASGGTVFLWGNNESTASITISPSANEDYSVTVTDANNCTNETTFTITINSLPVANAGDDLSACGPLQLDGSNSVPAANLSYLWSTSDGLITSGASTAMPVVEGAGMYQLLVTNLTTGCTHTDVTNILTGGMLDVKFSSTDISCAGDDDGTIEVEQVLNGIPPFQFFLNGQDYGTTSFFDNLSPGDYLLDVVDAGGCNMATLITILEPVTLLPNLGPDTLISVGKSVQLDAGVEADVYTWFSQDNNTLSCDDCRDPVATPYLPNGYSSNEAGTFEYIVNTEIAGCGIKADTILIGIFKSTEPFPVVVTPNGDGFNDRFEIIDVSNATYSELLIINRWGETVFQRSPFVIEDTWVGKDNNGNELPEGTYYYIIAVQYGTEPKKTILGPTILIRERD